MSQKLIKLTPDELKKLQYKSLEITECLVNFCEAHGLKVFLYAGSLLRTLRHYGFTPQDDDIDILKPYIDAKALIKLQNEFGEKDYYRFVPWIKNLNHQLIHNRSDAVSYLLYVISRKTLMSIQPIQRNRELRQL